MLTLRNKGQSTPEGKKVLILCVDRDDDIGVKAKVETPVIGKRENEKAATKLAVSDPEEADANAMFAAIKLYDELKSRPSGDAFEIATIAGSSLGGVRADEKLTSELGQILNDFHADSAILVSDGYTDWDVSPIITSRLPVLSVKRVVIRHDRSMELSWAILSRYLGMIGERPRYLRLALGVPGIVLLVLSVLWAFDLLRYALVTMLALVGGLMVFKGFKVDELIKTIKVPTTLPSPVRQFSIMTFVIGMVICIVGLYIGWYRAVGQIPLEFASSRLPQFIGIFASEALSFIVIGLCVSFGGGAIYWTFKGSEKVWGSITGIIIALGSWRIIGAICLLVIYPTEPLTDLLFYSLIDVPLMVIGLALIYMAHTRLRF